MELPELIDTHCHLDLKKHFQRPEKVQAAARSLGVAHHILPGVVRAGWKRMLELASANPGLHAAPGLHPMYLDYHRPEDLEELEELVAGDDVVALGEIGLDYYLPSLDRSKQQQLFEHQLQIASAARLPVLLHVRKAHDQVLATLRRKHFIHGGIIHAFNGSLQQAGHYIKLGFCIGICGTVTYDRARKIRKVAAALPRETMVLETDAPDIPPASHRGEANRPEYLVEILDALATLRGEPRTLTAAYTSANARRILKLKP